MTELEDSTGLTTTTGRGSGFSLTLGSAAVLGEEGPQQLVEGGLVAACHHTGRHRGHRRRSGHVHHERDLAEELPGTQDPSLAHRLLRDAGDAREQDVKTVAGVTFADEDGARGDVLALHPVGELRERLARQRLEQADLRELGHGCGNMARRHAKYGTPMGILAGWRYCPRCASELAVREARVECEKCGLVHYAKSAPAVSALVVDDAGRMLLARRAHDPDAGLWDTLGGFLDEGEHPLDGLRRELVEETGLEVEPGEFLGTYVDTYGDDPEATSVLNLVWEARIVSGDPAPADDVSELRWFPRDAPPPPEECAFRWVAQFLHSSKSAES